MASAWYNRGIVKVMSGSVNLASCPSLGVMLMQDSHTPSSAAHEVVSDISGDVSDASTYGDYTYLSPNLMSVHENETSSYAEWETTESITWSSLGGNTNNTLQYAVIYYAPTDTPASQSLICYLDFTAKVTTGGDFKLNFSAAAIGYVST